MTIPGQQNLNEPPSMVVNFDDDESCKLLAELIDKARNLRICNIASSHGERYVRVKVTYAEEATGNKGLIEVVNLRLLEQED